MCELIKKREQCEKCNHVAIIETGLEPCKGAAQSGEICTDAKETPITRSIGPEECIICFFEEQEKEEKKPMDTIHEGDEE